LFTSNKDELRGEAIKFDTVISLDVLEHMPDLPGELNYLNSLLAPGGRLILTVPMGATKSHPMHLAHEVRAIEILTKFGFRNVKDWKLRLTGSEILRKRDCVVMQKPDHVTASASGGSGPRS
jgi:2-polyprenyl-3-methyl-5-hydroxy-6-metoxy-1,4-benzoquinol methylase